MNTDNNKTDRQKETALDTDNNKTDRQKETAMNTDNNKTDRYRKRRPWTLIVTRLTEIEGDSLGL